MQKIKALPLLQVDYMGCVELAYKYDLNKIGGWCLNCKILKSFSINFNIWYAISERVNIYANSDTNVRP